jgi:hypothetical protein
MTAHLSANKKEVIWEKVEEDRFDILVETVQLNTGVVVDVDVLPLCNSKVLIVMQPPSIANCLS